MTRSFFENRMTDRLPIRVIKLGGSLLDLDDLPERFDRWMVAQSPMHNVLIVGGGKLVDALRDLHGRFQLDERETHWMAVDLLEMTGGIVAGLLPAWSVVIGMAELSASIQSPKPANLIFVAGAWLRTRTDVPETWEITSDSIAALVANHLKAEELVLLKSTMAPAIDEEMAGEELAVGELVGEGFYESVARLSKVGFVDPQFSHRFKEGEVRKLRLVNLRDESFEQAEMIRRS